MQDLTLFPGVDMPGNGKRVGTITSTIRVIVKRNGGDRTADVTRRAVDFIGAVDIADTPDGIVLVNTPVAIDIGGGHGLAEPVVDFINR